MFKVKKINHNLRTKLLLEQPQFKTIKYGRESLKYEGAKLWNSLENFIKESQTLYSFKEMVKKWPGICCSCSTCPTCVLGNM